MSAEGQGQGTFLSNEWTYVTDLIRDFPDMTVDLQVRVADPLVEVQAVINLTDFLLSVLGSNHLYHVRHGVDFHLVLFVN